jgi:hypothetical protein
VLLGVALTLQQYRSRPAAAGRRRVEGDVPVGVINTVKSICRLDGANTSAQPKHDDGRGAECKGGGRGREKHGKVNKLCLSSRRRTMQAALQNACGKYNMHW